MILYYIVLLPRSSKSQVAWHSNARHSPTESSFSWVRALRFTRAGMVSQMRMMFSFMSFSSANLFFFWPSFHLLPSEARLLGNNRYILKDLQRSKKGLAKRRYSRCGSLMRVLHLPSQ